jgi:hypothetical protein
MTGWGDPWEVDDNMEWTDLDVERLIRGATGDQVPPGLEEAAAMLSVARGPAEADEVGDRIGVATALASTTAVLKAAKGAPWWRAPRWVAVGAIAAVLVTSGVAAAATHGLNSGSSSPSSDNASSIDATHTSNGKSASSTSVEPSTSAEPATSVESTTEPSTTVASGDQNGVGPLAIGPAMHGLCTAFAQRSDQPGSSVAYRNLAEAAAAVHQAIKDLCAAVLGPAGNAPANASAQPGFDTGPGHHDAAPPGWSKGKGHGNGQGQGD